MPEHYKRHQRGGIFHYYETDGKQMTVINFLNAAPIIETRPHDPELAGVSQRIPPKRFKAAFDLAMENPETQIR